MNFITRKFTEYTYERLCEQTTHNKYPTIETFLQHNKKCLESLNKDDLDFIYKLIIKISNEYIIMVDEEIMDNEWEAQCIYFNVNNKLVIMHPR